MRLASITAFGSIFVIILIVLRCDHKQVFFAQFSLCTWFLIALAAVIQKDKDATEQELIATVRVVVVVLKGELSLQHQSLTLAVFVNHVVMLFVCHGHDSNEHVEDGDLGHKGRPNEEKHGKEVLKLNPHLCSIREVLTFSEQMQPVEIAKNKVIHAKYARPENPLAV